MNTYKFVIILFMFNFLVGLVMTNLGENYEQAFVSSYETGMRIQGDIDLSLDKSSTEDSDSSVNKMAGSQLEDSANVRNILQMEFMPWNFYHATNPLERVIFLPLNVLKTMWIVMLAIVVFQNFWNSKSD